MAWNGIEVIGREYESLVGIKYFKENICFVSAEKKLLFILFIHKYAMARAITNRTMISDEKG